MPGFEGFWVFVAGDLAIFTLVFFAFVHARSADVAGFEAARATLDVDRGGINTLVLLTSSACIATALTRLRAGNNSAAAQWTAVGIAGGVAFIVLKISEYASGFGAGHTPSSGQFFVYYMTLTGLHLGHVIAGCLILGICWYRMRRSLTTVTGFTTAAAYWHLVDFLWLLIFPLVYLVR